MAANETAVGALDTPTTARKTTCLDSRSTSTAAQIARLLEMLRAAPRHTHELRRLGISHPAGRVQDLVKRGYRIDSARVTTVDSDGYTHVGVARYALLAEPEATRGQRTE